MLVKWLMYYYLDFVLIANLEISCCKISLVLRTAVKLGLVAPTCDPRTQEAVAGRWEVYSYAGIHRETANPKQNHLDELSDTQSVDHCVICYVQELFSLYLN